jgi:hypothetical protein
MIEANPAEWWPIVSPGGGTVRVELEGLCASDPRGARIVTLSADVGRGKMVSPTRTTAGTRSDLLTRRFYVLDHGSFELGPELAGLLQPLLRRKGEISRRVSESVRAAVWPAVDSDPSTGIPLRGREDSGISLG